ncbi:hypothetical protein [Streptomyces beihaiensis]|uniref:Integral membrane protein n=1 Tax=Streptomyces beihaiensis TaxID=2984495 RepID=A0ABT3TMD7_9ACTN|nr:hypothetical protein [Streptomyces beihaiensis]MCX3058209.1 hypothetical protein [Streptomyces beihaiensis]
MTEPYAPPSRHAPPPGTAKAPPHAGLSARLRRRPVTIRFDRREAHLATGVYVAVSLVGFAVLLVLAHRLGHPPESVLRRWDSGNYLGIAEHGYPSEIRYLPDGTPRWSRLAFFPLLPALVRATHLFTGLAFPWAGVVVVWVCGALAAAGIHTLVRSLAGRAVGFACVALWTCSPYAFALWVPYSEAVFSAALFWCLVALVARRWVTAGVLCMVAGLVRPTTMVLVGVIAFAALRALWERRASWAPDALRPLAALALAPVGLCVSWLYIGSRVGRVDGWFEAERAWGQSFDFGAGKLVFLEQVARFHEFDIRQAVVLAVILLTAVALTALVLDRSVPWPLVLAAAGVYVLMLGTPGSPYSSPRFILPVLPLLLIPVARGVAPAQPLVRWSLYGCGAVFSGWYAVGLLLVFRKSP